MPRTRETVILHTTNLTSGVKQEAYSALVIDLQARYAALRQTLETLGSLVLDEGIEEKAADIPPNNFTRSGVCEYIFPPQDTYPWEPEERVINPRDPEDYALTSYRHASGFEPDLVTAYIQIRYQDAQDPPRMAIIDLLGDSDIPPEVLEAMAAAFEGVSSQLEPLRIE